MKIDNMVDASDDLVFWIELLSKSLDVAMQALRENFPAPKGYYYSVGADHRIHIYSLGE